MFINSNTVINNILWETTRPYFAPQNSHGHENFFEMYKTFGHAPPISLASSDLGLSFRDYYVP